MATKPLTESRSNTRAKAPKAARKPRGARKSNANAGGGARKDS